jgi:hypothetical protein
MACWPVLAFVPIQKIHPGGPGKLKTPKLFPVQEPEPLTDPASRLPGMSPALRSWIEHVIAPILIKEILG